MPTRGSRRRKATWPMKSEALGVMPGQSAEAIQQSRAAGVATHFDEQGYAILESRSHRKKLCEALGYWDKDGGFGDPQRR
jgi:hypothetical protein